MIKINDRILEERIGQLKKGIEIVGGKKYLATECLNDEYIVTKIVNSAFNNNELKFHINNIDFTVDQLLSIKVDFEKYFLKSKPKTLQSIIYKIKKYDTSLDTLIRKYRKSGSIEEYREICKAIEKTYRRDINMLVLKAIGAEEIESLLAEDEEKYYGEYLIQKKKTIIDNVISKMNIV